MATIWVIDDDPAIADLLASTLQEIGHDSRVFTNARDALAAYKPGAADVVMTDIRMPGMDGLELTRLLLAKDPKATIVILTGYPSVEDAVEAIKLGAMDYMTKPFRIEEIRLRLLRVLESRDLSERFRRNRALTWLLIGSLPVWFILGILLALVIAKF
ncbi:MAG: response regulator [Kiritimatiellae bacterium]|nr:response regulator [Kiritimatiellia bacterium]MDW8458583.1 response regulator [Verrucomicrobiota bacterium]